MSRLDELIQELCPNGVEYVTLGSVIEKFSVKAKHHPEIKKFMQYLRITA